MLFASLCPAEIGAVPCVQRLTVVFDFCKCFCLCSGNMGRGFGPQGSNEMVNNNVVQNLLQRMPQPMAQVVSSLNNPGAFFNGTSGQSTVYAFCLVSVWSVRLAFSC